MEAHKAANKEVRAACGERLWWVVCERLFEGVSEGSNREWLWRIGEMQGAEDEGTYSIAALSQRVGTDGPCERTQRALCRALASLGEQRVSYVGLDGVVDGEANGRCCRKSRLTSLMPGASSETTRSWPVAVGTKQQIENRVRIQVLWMRNGKVVEGCGGRRAGEAEGRRLMDCASS